MQWEKMKTIRNGIENNMPFYSFIIPTKKDKYLDKTINSILRFAIEKDEIIIIGELYDGFKKSDKRIRIIRKGGVLAGKARNIGFLSAKNENLAFIDCGVVLNGFKRLRLDDHTICFPFVYPSEKYFEWSYPISCSVNLMLFYMNIRKKFSQSRYFLVSKKCFEKNRLFFPEWIHFGDENIWVEKIFREKIPIFIDQEYTCEYIEKLSPLRLFAKTMRYGMSDWATRNQLKWQGIRFLIYFSLFINPLIFLLYLIIEVFPVFLIAKRLTIHRINISKVILGIIIKDLGMMLGLIMGLIYEK